MYILAIYNGKHDLVQQVTFPIHQASSLKVLPEILSIDMACGPERATTPVDVDGWPGWPKSWLGESADAGRELSVAGALGLHIRVGTGDDNWFYPGGTHQCYPSLCARVSTLELSLVMVDGNVWKPARVPALRLGTALRCAGPPSAYFGGILDIIGSGLIISRLIMIQAKLCFQWLLLKNADDTASISQAAHNNI